MQHDYDKINKILDEAFEYTGGLLREMYEKFPRDEQPYFLHILLNGCAHGLAHFGCDDEQIIGFVKETLDEAKIKFRRASNAVH